MKISFFKRGKPCLSILIYVFMIMLYSLTSVDMAEDFTIFYMYEGEAGQEKYK